MLFEIFLFLIGVAASRLYFYKNNAPQIENNPNIRMLQAAYQNFGNQNNLELSEERERERERERGDNKATSYFVR